MFSNVERSVRHLRRRRGWPQRALGARAGVSREMVSRAERGELAGMTIGSVNRIVAALGGSLHLQVRWQGEQLDRLIDAIHARIQQTVAESITALGWHVRVEVSFNHYGDRGRVDLLAWHPRHGVALVIEVKSALGDLQETLGRLDVKTRLGPMLARDAGWQRVEVIVPALVIGDSRTARAVVAQHEALFARYNLRGRGAWAWLRRPSPPLPTGLIWFTNVPDSRNTTIRRDQRPPNRTDSYGA